MIFIEFSSFVPTARHLNPSGQKIFSQEITKSFAESLDMLKLITSSKQVVDLFQNIAEEATMKIPANTHSCFVLEIKLKSFI